MTLKAVAWDIDGTLIDSEPLHLRALLAASRRWDVDLSDLPHDRFRGIHMHDVWAALDRRFPADLARREWLAAVEDAYVAEAATLAPLAGAVEAIHSLAAAGLRQVCVSNSNRRIVDANIAALGIGRDLVFSISFDDVPRGKPDPAPYRLACERLHLHAEEVLAVEDSRPGLQAALSAGLRTAAVGPDLIGNTDADIVVSRFEELVDWVAAAQHGAERGR